MAHNHHGLLVIDKPPGLTSRDVVNRALRWFPRRTRIGHMGTLDPLATGVLVLGIGDGTRLTEFVQDMDKVYRAGIQLGAESDTDDADGRVTIVEGAVPPAEDQVRVELARFLGEIEQVPPDYSAVKVTGRRAYDLARQGDALALSGRTVRVYDVHVVSCAYPHLDVEIRCGKGTYIRSLARDLGQRLGCGGLIASLRRLRIGPFTTDLAVPLDSSVRPNLLPLALAVSALPSLKVDAEQVRLLRQGRAIALQQPLLSAVDENSTSAIFDDQNVLIGIGRIEKGNLRPDRILRYG